MGSVEADALVAQPGQRVGGDLTAECGGQTGTGVVDQDHHDVRCVVGQPLGRRIGEHTDSCIVRPAEDPHATDASPYGRAIWVAGWAYPNTEAGGTPVPRIAIDSCTIGTGTLGGPAPHLISSMGDEVPTFIDPNSRS